MRTLAVGAVVAFALASPAAESTLENVVSSIDIEFHGRLKADAAYDTSKVQTGNYALYVLQEGTATTPPNDDEFNMTANETRLWFDLKGPVVSGVKTGGRVEFDFYGANADENKAALMLRRAYIEVLWEEHGLGLLAGQHSDVISPLVMSTLNYTVGWDMGNIGYRRPQVRVTKTFDLGDQFLLDIAGAITRTIGGESFAGVANDYGEDAGFPTVQSRVGLKLPSIGTRPAEVGISGHYGKEQVKGAGIPETNLETYSLNLDAKVPIMLDAKIGGTRLDFELTGELFLGRNLDNYFGGIGQGINITEVKSITATGGWGQLSYVGIADWRINVGGGADNPYDALVPAAGRLFNRYIFTNFFYNVTRQLQVGIEYSNIKTSYRGRDGTDDRIQFSMIYTF